MDDIGFEARPHTARTSVTGEPVRQSRFGKGSKVEPYLPGSSTRTSLEDDAHTGGSGDRLCELERHLASTLSTDLLNVLVPPSRRDVPDCERNKVACLKSAILNLQKENNALCWELWRVKRSQEEARRKQKEDPLSPAERRMANSSSPRSSDRNAACQILRSPKSSEHKTKQPTSRPSSSNAGIETSSPISSHSKCVDWLCHRKPADDKEDQFHLVRLALWQLWELADRALNRSVRSDGGCHLQSHEDGIDEEESNYFEKGSIGVTRRSGAEELSKMKSQLARMQRSKEHLKRRRDEQALLLQQKEMQVTRLQRSRSHLSRSFKAQFQLLQKQQALELKALQLQMQTEHASSLAGQNAEMEEQLQGAVEQLEEKYRCMLKEALNERRKDSVTNLQLCSVASRHSRGESGT